MSDEHAAGAEHTHHGHAHTSHHHAHHHAHAHGGSFADENARHYDASAQEYDARPDVQELARRVAAAIQKLHPALLDEDRTAVLDYACGTGALSRELAPHVRSVLGVDISQGMVDVYNARVANQGIPPEEMRAVCVELKGTGDELDGAKFDVITCSMAYHHFSSIEDTTRLLASFLRPGGSLLVVDIIKGEQEVTPESFKHIVAHRSGFAESEIREVFERSGLTDFSFARATHAKTHGHDVDIFVARGRKPL